MKYYFYLLCLLILSCKKTDSTVQKGALPKDCFSPTSGINKFRTLNGDTLYNGILRALQNDRLNVSDENKLAIKDWTTKKVMGSVFQDENIVEWNIYDEDFCSNRITRINDANGKLIDSVSIQTCNTKLNKNVSCGSSWILNLKNQLKSINIEFCSKIIKTQKRVGFYQIVNKNGKLERTTSNYQFKREVITDVFVTYIGTSNTTNTQKIYSDNAILYDPTVFDTK